MEFTALLLVLMATVTWGMGDVFARRAMFGARTETVLVAIIAMVVVSLGATGLVLEGAAVFSPSGLRFLALTATMGVLAWVGGNLLYFHALKLAGVVIAAPILGAAPLFAIGMAVAFGGESPGAATLAGAVLIVVGVAVLVTDRDSVVQ
jgi:drug/metabolite transporter (DMT)-like permease